jgi:hypothetical protein
MRILIKNPWDDLLIPPTNRLSRRRISSESHHELLWFRDENSYRGLLIEVDNSVTPAHLRAFDISLKNVQIDIHEMADEGFRALLIRLTDSSKIDVFSRLCHDIVERVIECKTTDSTFRITCRRLKKWQELLSGGRNGVLSAIEIQGLFAELCFLDELLEHRYMSNREAVLGWKGPARAQQDFILDDTAVEIKSLSGQYRSKVRISTEHQLFSHLSRLFLRVYMLTEVHSDSDGENLNMIIRRIYERIVDDELRSAFSATLDAAGYLDLPEYDQPCFVLKGCLTYHVTVGFPRIIQASLPLGITTVSYDLELSAIEPFRVSNEQIMEN